MLRAAATVSGCDEIVVIGSQAILGSTPDAPAGLLWSQEADVYPRTMPERAEAIDGALGDGSQFHATFGYYAHGVGPETAKAPLGWEQRLVAVRVEKIPRREGEVVGWCMEPHDLVLAKCVAGRDRDWEFAREAVANGIVDHAELLHRAAELPIDDVQRDHLVRLLHGLGA